MGDLLGDFIRIAIASLVGVASSLATDKWQDSRRRRADLREGYARYLVAHDHLVRALDEAVRSLRDDSPGADLSRVDGALGQVRDDIREAVAAAHTIYLLERDTAIRALVDRAHDRTTRVGDQVAEVVRILRLDQESRRGLVDEIAKRRGRELSNVQHAALEEIATHIADADESVRVQRREIQQGFEVGVRDLRTTLVLLRDAVASRPN